MKKKLPNRLSKLIKTDDKKAFEDYWNYESTQQVFKVLCEHLEDLTESNIKNSEKKGKYENPNWALSHADDIGYRRCLHEIQNLIGADHG